MAKATPPRAAPAVKAGCGQCEATGFLGGDPVRHNNPFCPQCKGSGTVLIPADQARDCPACQGRGHVEHVPCPPCGHTGKILPAAPPPPPAPDERDQQIEDLKAQIKDLKKQLKDAAKAPATNNQ